MAKRRASDYVALARTAILALLEEETAAAWIEVEAKVGDNKHSSIGIAIEPHHLSEARRALVDDGELEITEAATRGGRKIPILHLPGASGRKFTDASARKRLLAARYYSWTTGSPSRPGKVGPAGEQAMHTALQVAAPAGYRLINPGQAAPKLLGVELHGPLDAAAHYLPVDEHGIPGGATTVPIEVKNIRDWIYPTSAELYQLLNKSAILQVANPNHPIAPVLLCRRAHITTMRMAKDLGIFIIPVSRQYISNVDETHLTEIRTELALTDLVQQVGPDERLVKFMTTHLPKVIDRTAENWSTFGPELQETFAALLKEKSRARRNALLNNVRATYRNITGDRPVGW